jgi:carbonic anhydrase
MGTYEQIFRNNQKWVASKLAIDKQFFEKIAHGQQPEYVYIGCSDSRVTAEEMMGAQPGEVFVHRNVGNLVNTIDLNVQTVLNYAVRILEVKHIVVCGHYGCGAIRAALEPKDLGILNPWLRNIRDVYRLHKTELNEIHDEQQRNRRLVELNVREQCINVSKLASVQQGFMFKGYPVVHGWVFDVATGLLSDLEIDFTEIMHGIQDIYNLTDIDRTRPG